MISSNEMMDSIESKKEYVAKLISWAFADNDVQKADLYYSEILKRIKENKIFVFETNDGILTNYVKKIESLLNEISSFLGENVRDSYYNMSKPNYLIDPYTADMRGLEKKEKFEIDFAYFFSSSMFLRLDITYKKFVALYRERGMKEILKLTKMVRNLKTLTKFSHLKVFFSNISDRRNFSVSVNKISKMIEQYNIKSMDDIMKFYTEVCSCLIDKNKLSEDERKIIEENELDLIKRAGDQLAQNPKKLKELKKKLEVIYEDEFVSRCFDNSNVKDFFSRYNIGFSKNNLKKVIYLYTNSHSSFGFNTRIKFDEGEFNVSIFRNSELIRGANTQNEIIIHELIHSLETINRDVEQYPFNDKCRYLNEAITQYFTLKVLKDLEFNLIENETVVDDKFNCSYNMLLPLVTILKDSPLWDDLMWSKINNDYSMFIERIGKDALKISKIFDEVYSIRNKGFEYRSSKIEDGKVELIKIIDRIIKENSRYNKKTMI